MPFTTGTAVSPSDLMVQINTFITANNWTRLRGETDLVPASPKAARYWRIVITETENTSSQERRLRNVELRTTLGGANQATTGANWSTSSESASFPVSNLASGDTSEWRSLSVGAGPLTWITYDFGSATTIRQVEIECALDDFAPLDFTIQWSNDNRTFCTMRSITGQAWTDNQTLTFDFDNAFVDPQHVSSTIKRTSGLQIDQQLSQANDDWFVWQGPGFDASRRVIVAMSSEFDLGQNTHWLRCTGMTDFDNANVDVRLNENGLTELKQLTFGSASVSWWLYVDDSRMIIIIRTGVSDYSSAFLGFGNPFALPSQWSFPLVIAATSSDLQPIGSTNNDQASCCDPGSGAAAFLRWDNDWFTIENRASGSEEDRPVSTQYAVWPWHTGAVPQFTDFPSALLPDAQDGLGAHWLDRMDATVQNDLPVLPAILVSNEFGNLMALDGIFAIPNPGTLSPEQVVTISGQAYRVFANRFRTSGNHYFLIREL